MLEVLTIYKFIFYLQISCLVPICGYPTPNMVRDKEPEAVSFRVLIDHQDKIPPEILQSPTSAPSPKPLAEVIQLQSMSSLNKLPEKLSAHEVAPSRTVREPTPPVPPSGFDSNSDYQPIKASYDQPDTTITKQSSHSLKSSSKTLPPLARTPPLRVSSSIEDEPKRASSSDKKSSDEDASGGIGMDILTSSMRPSAESISDALPRAFGTENIKPPIPATLGATMHLSGVGQYCSAVSSVSSLPPLKRVPVSGSLADVTIEEEKSP